jgi:glycosyltransferase involved in cell wall biosynthesis
VLKVLQLIPTLDRSGAEKQMVLLAKGLPRDRFYVEVAALTRLGPLEVELRDAGIPVTVIGKRFKVDPIALFSLNRFLKAKAFDIVQTWIFAANTYGRVASRIAHVPIVVVTEMAVDIWKGRFNRSVDRYLSKWCDRLVGNSRAVVEFYEQLGVPKDKLALIYSGADDETPAQTDLLAVRNALGFKAETPLILFAGRLAEQKRVDDLLKALVLLQYVEPDAHTMIVGDGPLRNHLEEASQAYHLDSRVRFLGHREDVPELMAASDLVILPSAFEGLPNVLLEAMRLRKPVVATAAPGTTEVVVNGQTGLLVPIGNPPLLARAIRDVIRNPEAATQFARAGQARVEKLFRVDTMVAQFAELYEELARAKGVLIA